MAQTAVDDTVHGFFNESRRSNWIRLRTMILLRWFAIAGQLAAIVIGTWLYNLDLETGLCMLVVGVSVVGNLIASFIFPENKRLTEFENLLMVLFDVFQLAFLLFLTGGLSNPFSLLVLAPVTVSAAVLTVRSTVILNIFSFFLVSGLVFFHLPLVTTAGVELRIPDLFVFGQWVAIMIAQVFISVYAWRLAHEMHGMSDALSATQMALERTQKLNDLGGVVAAAAHELGTPLATIKLTSSELIEELEGSAELQDDARLIREQADRCRDILRSMGRAGKDDLQLRFAPLSEIIREAAEPHQDRGKIIEVVFTNPGNEFGQEPNVQRKPEIIHGLRNLVQNAVDFSETMVWIEAAWTNDEISIRIVDDGRGFPVHLLGRIGDPFMRRRRSEQDQSKRPEYEGMGLGLFIAKTLLERTGAALSFANGAGRAVVELGISDGKGAIVEVVWPKSAIEAGADMVRAPLGDNQQFRG